MVKRKGKKNLLEIKSRVRGWGVFVYVHMHVFF